VTWCWELCFLFTSRARMVYHVVWYRYDFEYRLSPNPPTVFQFARVATGLLLYFTVYNFHLLPFFCVISKYNFCNIMLVVLICILSKIIKLRCFKEGGGVGGEGDLPVVWHFFHGGKRRGATSVYMRCCYLCHKHQLIYTIVTSCTPWFVNNQRRGKCRH
jgi:hypothetical protein